MRRRASLDQTKDSKIKGVPARGKGWDAWEAPPAKRHRRIVFLGAATLPPITRPAFGHQYSRILALRYSQKVWRAARPENIAASMKVPLSDRVIWVCLCEQSIKSERISDSDDVARG